MPASAAAILDLLPQTQCTRCGYADCEAYAHAIADDAQTINRCPPGGAEGVQRLARLTGREPAPLDAACGTEGPRGVAVIDEAWCIGCTKCLDACPTDAIAGVSKRMHTVIDAHCTGCELCLPVCPVDCISMETVTPGRTGWAAWSAAQAQQARERYQRHRAREAGRQLPVAVPTIAPDAAAADRKRAAIEAALARARQAAQGRGGRPG